MIYLIFGPDTYRSRALVKEIIAQFEKKAGGITPAFFRWDAEEAADDAAVRSFAGPSLFGEKQLILIERAMSAKKDFGRVFTPLLAPWAKSSHATVIFWDEDIGKGSAFFAAVKKYAEKTQEFPILLGEKFRRWALGEAEKRDVKLPKRIEENIIASSAGDSWRFIQELEKSAVGGTVSDFRNGGEEKVWDFTDSFFNDKKKSFVSAFRMLENGADPLYLSGAFAKTLRMLAVFRDAIDKKEDPERVSKKLGLHPFVAKKNIGVARGLAFSLLERRHAVLREADENMKTGRLPASLALLSLFVRD